MVACMAGSTLYGILVKRMPAEELLLKVFGVSAIALGLPVLFSSTHVVYLGFLVFEVTVGIYFPAMYTLKSKLVPEEARASIYNIFRVPLNFIVLGVLLSDISTTSAFMCCAVLLGVAAYTQYRLMQLQPVPAREKDEESLADLLDSQDDQSDGRMSV